MRLAKEVFFTILAWSVCSILTVAFAQDTAPTSFSSFEEIQNTLVPRLYEVLENTPELGRLAKKQAEYVKSLRHPGAYGTVRLNLHLFKTRSIPQFEQELLIWKTQFEQKGLLNAGIEAYLSTLDGLKNIYQVCDEAQRNQIARELDFLQTRKGEILDHYMTVVSDLARMRSMVGLDASSEAFLNRFSLRMNESSIKAFGQDYLPANYMSALVGKPSFLAFKHEGDIYSFFPNGRFLQGVELATIAHQKTDEAFFNFARLVLVQKLISELGEVQTFKLEPIGQIGLPPNLQQTFASLNLAEEIQRQFEYAQGEQSFRTRLVSQLTSDEVLTTHYLDNGLLAQMQQALLPEKFTSRYGSSFWFELQDLIRKTLLLLRDKEKESIREALTKYLEIPEPLLTKNEDEFASELREIILKSASISLVSHIEEVIGVLKGRFLRERSRDPVTALDFIIESYNDAPTGSLGEADIANLRILTLAKGKSKETILNVFEELGENLKDPFDLAYIAAIRASEGRKQGFSESISTFRLKLKIAEAKHSTQYARFEENRKQFVQKLLATSRELDRFLKSTDRNFKVDMALLDFALQQSYPLEHLNAMALTAKDRLLQMNKPQERHEAYVSVMNEHFNSYREECALQPAEWFKLIDQDSLVNISSTRSLLNSHNTEASENLDDVQKEICGFKKTTLLNLLKLGDWFGFAKPIPREYVVLSDLTLTKEEVESYKIQIKDQVLSNTPVLAVTMENTGVFSRVELYQKLADLVGPSIIVDKLADGYLSTALNVLEQKIRQDIQAVDQAQNIDDLSHVVARSKQLNLLLRDEYYNMLANHHERLVQQVFYPSQTEKLWQGFTQKFFILSLSYSFIRWVTPYISSNLGNLAIRTGASKLFFVAPLMTPFVKPLFNELGKFVGPLFGGWLMTTIFAVDTVYDTHKLFWREKKARDQVEDFFLVSAEGFGFYEHLHVDATRDHYENRLKFWLIRPAILFPYFIGGKIMGWYNQHTTNVYADHFRVLGCAEGQFPWNEHVINRYATQMRIFIQNYEGWDEAQKARALWRVNVAEEAILGQIRSTALRIEDMLDDLAWEYDRVGVPRRSSFEAVKTRYAEVQHTKEVEEGYKNLEQFFEPSYGPMTRGFVKLLGKLGWPTGSETHPMWKGLYERAASYGRSMPDPSAFGGNNYHGPNFDPGVF